MINAIIVTVLLFVVLFALLRAKKHFKGGGCCGSGSNTIRPRKKLEHPAIGKTLLTIEGMHCENCQARIENALDRLDGVVCRVELRKKTATVTYDRPIDPELLRQAVEKLGYTVTEIH